MAFVHVYWHILERPRDKSASFGRLQTTILTKGIKLRPFVRSTGHKACEIYGAFTSCAFPTLATHAWLWQTSFSCVSGRSGTR
eukprot:7307529-Heterocapsa_arctica.AAC.1